MSAEDNFFPVYSTGSNEVGRTNSTVYQKPKIEKALLKCAKWWIIEHFIKKIA